ncbi:MAG: LamG-like jellyroll fold domain-containing protein [bacterium]
MAGATGYSVEVALKSSFSTVVYSRTVSQSNQVQLDTLAQGTTFFWRVRAAKDSSAGTWSETRRFRTAGNNLNDGLVAYFPLNGNANDFAGNDNNGTLRNGVQSAADRFGVFGRAYDFNGTDGYIDFAESPSVRAIEKEVSVAVWVKPRSYKQEAGVMLRDEFWNLLLVNGQATGLIFDENGNQNRIVGSQLAPLNTWSHIAFTYNGSTIRVYMNGQQTGQLAFGAIRIGRTNLLKNPTLGKGIGNNQHYFDGVIDEVFVYNRTLSNAELALISFLLIIPLQSPVVAQQLSVGANYGTAFSSSNLSQFAEPGSGGRINLNYMLNYNLAAQIAIGYIKFGEKSVGNNFNIQSSYLPITGGIEYYFLYGKSSPYIGGTIGYFIAGGDLPSEYTQLGISPNVGYRMFLGDKLRLNVAADYNIIFAGYTPAYLQLKLGIEWEWEIEPLF